MVQPVDPGLDMAPVEMIRGLAVSRRSFADIVALLIEWAGRGDRMRYFACVNAHSAEVAHRDRRFMESLQGADLLVADGAGVVLASLILGGRIRERSTGPDLFMAVSERLDAAGGKSVFYLGGNAATLEKIAAKHREAFPRLAIAGMHAPPFRANFSTDDLDAIVVSVSRAAPDVLWIGLGAPKQEKLILDIRQRVAVPLCGPIGAMFDYFAGNVAMPPKWVKGMGLHWLYRLAKNPRRLWQRNLDSPIFLFHVVKERLAMGRQR